MTRIRLVWATLIGMYFLAATAPLSAHDSRSGSSPDFTGIWVSPGGPGDNDAKRDPALKRPEPAPMELTPEYQAKFDAIRALSVAAQSPQGAGRDKRDSLPVRRSVECLPGGVVAMMSAEFPLEIIQRPEQITMILESPNEVRRIYIGKKQLPLEEVDPGFWGHSVGEWRGKTLVVNTIGVREDIGVRESFFNWNFFPHSPEMVLTERITLVSPDVIHDEITLTDPASLRRPYSYTIPLKRVKNSEILEYVCEGRHEQIDSEGRIRMQVKGEQ